jgi:diketogulonate reductase-like aldo/keto reductase
VIPKSSSPEHVRENLALFDWELEEDDRRRLDGIDRDRPVYDTPARDWSGDVYGISE